VHDLYLESSRSDYDHATYDVGIEGNTVRAAQERGGLEAILRSRSNAPQGSIKIKDMTPAEKNAYDNKTIAQRG
jgi:hypothetical protein